MIYSFTNDDIAAAFIEAKRRGVDIKLVMDNEQLNVHGGEYRALVEGGVNVRVDRRSGIMHNKVAVIDGKIVITGSYNWSSGAENLNRENLIIIKDPALTSKYQKNCEDIWRESTP
jgi:phosphatidylserine/phosphatidylglycerophosphate/cardiolipin synthase-like enzyme